MFQISNNGLPAQMSGPDRRAAALERARAWQESATNAFADESGSSVNRLGVMAQDQLAASTRNIEQAMARHAEKKAAEASKKGGGIFSKVLGLAGNAIGGPIGGSIGSTIGGLFG